jgi:3-isopropylmalate/(R)-2-methylmalate dehydratase small subunit
VPAEFVEQLMAAIKADPSLEITVDVERRTVSAPAAGLEAEFPLDPATQERFLEGLDDIGISLRHEADITAYEATRPAWLPSATASAS